MGKVIAEDEDELLDELEDFDDDDEEAIGLGDADALDLAEIEDAPEDVGLDVETFAGTEDGLGLDDDDDEDPTESALDDATLDIDGELDDDEDEHGWTEGSEGTGGAFDEPLDDEDEAAGADDGGLEGVDDPLIDALVDDKEHSIPIDGGGDDDDGEGVLDRLELDLG